MRLAATWPPANSREVSSATISAAGWIVRASPTPCPAHSDSASMSPVVPAIGGAGSYRTMSSPEANRAITSPAPGRWLSGGRPAASHARAVELRSARCGASGHPTSYRSGYHCASVSAAAISRRRYSSCTGISSASRNRVPSHAAWAPRASTAATPRASPIPPAAITGTGATASTTAGISGRVAIVPHTWPPASQPWATMTSTPDATDRRASSAVPTVCMTRPPASWTGPT